MPKPKRETVTIRLTPEQAAHVFWNADGWMDAGACEGGMNADEHEALEEMRDQISRQIFNKRKSPTPTPQTGEGKHER